jgi:hypothetical protein
MKCPVDISGCAEVTAKSLQCLGFKPTGKIVFPMNTAQLAKDRPNPGPYIVGVVSALQDTQQLTLTHLCRELPQHPGHISNSSWSHPHRAHRITHHQIEPTGDEHKLRLIGPGDGHNQLIENPGILIIAMAAAQRYIDRVSKAVSFTGFVQRACSRIKRILMKGAVQHLVALVKAVLGAVTVMNIPIDNENTLQPQVANRPYGTYGDTVEQTESHSPVKLGMVARGTNQAQPIVNLSLVQSLDAIDDRTDGIQGGFK